MVQSLGITSDCIKVIELMVIFFDLLNLLLGHERIGLSLLFKVEVFEIDLALFKIRFEWRVDLHGFQSLDVQVFEPWVIKDFVYAILVA